jgi:hypothetical protein
MAGIERLERRSNAFAQRTWRLACEDSELMPESEDRRLEFEARTDEKPEAGQQGDEERGHPAADGISVRQELQRRQQLPSLW